jgi:hypothetical protein
MKKSKTESSIQKAINKLEKKLNIVLDLDNTIILCEVIKKEYREIIDKEIRSGNRHRLLTSFEDDMYVSYIYERPYLKYFLLSVYDNYNIYIYTNAHITYYNYVIEALVKKYPFLHISGFSAKQNITETNIKCLNWINIYTGYMINYGFLQNTIILDDRHDVWPLNLDNLLKIKPWENIDDHSDNVLLLVTDILLNLKNEFEKKLKNKSMYSVHFLLDKIKSNNNI